MKLKNLHIYIFLLLISLSMAQCDCNPKSRQPKQPSKESEKEKNRKKKKQKEEEEHLAERKKQEQQYGYEARKQNRENQHEKQQNKAAEVGKSPMSAQEKKEQLAKLVKEQEVLQNKAEESLKQLLEEEPDSPAQETFQDMPAYFEDAIEKVINDPTQIEAVIDDLEDIRDSLVTLRKLLDEGEVVYMNMFHAKVQDISASYDDANFEFRKGADPKFRDQRNQPIAFDKLSEREKKFYDRIVAKYPSAKNSAMAFVRKAETEDEKRLLKATNAQLARLYNIQQQQKLK